MLENLNLEIFGAFSAVLVVLLWIIKYFKNQYTQSEKERKRLQDEALKDKDEQLEVLRGINKVLEAQLEKEQEQDK